MSGASANGFVQHAFESGADDLVMSTATDESSEVAGQLRFAIEKAVARRTGAGAGEATAQASLICVLGPKGGIGKTLTSANLAVGLALAGRRVVVVDLDLQFGDVGLSLGLVPTRTIFDLVKSGGSLDSDKVEAYLTRHSSGVRVLMAPVRPDQASSVTIEFLRELYPLLRASNDFVIVDTPPGFTPEVIASIDSSTHICMVGMLDSLSLKNTKLGFETLELMGYKHDRIRMVLNRADTNVGVTHEDVSAIVGRAPDVMVPSHRDVVRSVNEGMPIVQGRPRTDVGAIVPLARRPLPRHRGPRAATAAAAEACLMDLQQRLAGVRPDDEGDAGDPFAEVKNRIHLGGHRRSRAAALQHRHEPGGAALAGHRRHPRAARARERARARGPRAPGRRDRRRHPRPRPARAAAGRRHRHRDHGQRPARHLGRAPRAPAVETPARFSDESHLRRIINKMVAQVGRRIDESSPMVDARLPDGSRVNAIIPPLSLSGPLVTIRKFSKQRLDPTDLVRLGTLSTETVEFLQRCVLAELNILISGGTGSGKTTLLNALSTAIPEDERIVTIEDAAELRLNQRHVLRLEARPKNIEGEGEISIRELVRNSLRMRPDRIIVGEVRGAEALDMLQAMNTGHDGSLSTVHANTPRDALARVETMVLMAGYDLPGQGHPPAGRLRARPDHPPRAPAGRHAPGHLDHRGRPHGVRRDHALRSSSTSRSTRCRPTARWSARSAPPACGPTFLDKFERHGIALPTQPVRATAARGRARSAGAQRRERRHCGIGALVAAGARHGAAPAQADTGCA